MAAAKPPAPAPTTITGASVTRHRRLSHPRSPSISDKPKCQCKLTLVGAECRRGTSTLAGSLGGTQVGTSLADWRADVALRLRLVRNRIIAREGFRRWAARVPGLRAITARRSNALFDLTVGFAYTQALRAMVELGIVEIVADRPRAAEAIAEATEVEVAALAPLLDAGVALDLLVRHGTLYAPGDLGVALLSEPGIAAMIRHHDLPYRDLAEPVTTLLRRGGGTRTSSFWQYSGGRAGDETTPEGAAAYSELMAITQAFVGREVVAAYPFARRRHLIDVGGGTGAFAERVALANPQIRATVIDLPDVARLADQRFERAGLAPRCGAISGSFHDDPIPSDGDTYSLVRVLYDHDDEPAVELLRRVRQSMPDHAELIVAEPMAELPGHERVGAYFAMYLAAMGSGRCRSPDRIRTMLREAGFARTKAHRVDQSVFTGLVVARPTAS